MILRVLARAVTREVALAESSDYGHGLLSELLHDSLALALIHAVSQDLHSSGPYTAIFSSLLECTSSLLLEID